MGELIVYEICYAEGKLNFSWHKRIRPTCETSNAILPLFDNFFDKWLFGNLWRHRRGKSKKFFGLFLGSKESENRIWRSGDDPRTAAVHHWTSENLSLFLTNTHRHTHSTHTIHALHKLTHHSSTPITHWTHTRCSHNFFYWKLQMPYFT